MTSFAKCYISAHPDGVVVVSPTGNEFYYSREMVQEVLAEGHEWNDELYCEVDNETLVMRVKDYRYLHQAMNECKYRE